MRNECRSRDLLARTVPFSSRACLTIGGGSMARPKEFNQDQALQQAIALFSRQGFAATSTDDLMHVMGISRQSMYDTSGDKRALFLEALYVTESVRRIQVELEKPGPPLSAGTKVLVTFAERKVATVVWDSTRSANLAKGMPT